MEVNPSKGLTFKLVGGGRKSKKKTFNFCGTIRETEKVILGNMCQDNMIFPEAFRNTQCTSNSITAICYSHYKSTENWDGGDIDNILLLGNSLHELSVSTYQSRYSRSAPVFLAADEVLPNIKIGASDYNIEYSYEAFQGIVGEENLLCEMKRFFSKFNHGVLTAKLLSIAVMQDENRKLWLFDSHSRNSNGQVENNGVAVACSFRDITDLVSLITNNFALKCHDLFCITPVLVTYDASHNENLDTLRESLESKCFCVQNVNGGSIEGDRNSNEHDRSEEVIKIDTLEICSVLTSENFAKRKVVCKNERIKNLNVRRSKGESMKASRIKKEYADKEKEKNRKRKHISRKGTGVNIQCVQKEKEREASRKRVLEKEKERDAIRKRDLRKDAEFAEQEKEQEAIRKRVLRTDSEYLEKEKERDAIRKRDLRKDAEFAEQEKEQEAIRKRVLRTDSEYLEKEKERDAIRKRDLRKDAEFAEQEKEQEAIRKRVLRTDSEYLEKEKERDAIRKRDLRKDAEFAEQEKEQEAIRKRVLRTDSEYLEKEKERDAIRKRDLRKDAEFAEQEKEQKASRMRVLRTDSEYLEKEKERDVIRKRELRKLPEFSEQEREIEASRKRKVRMDSAYSAREKLQDVCRKKQLRRSHGMRENERIKDVTYRRKMRLNSLFRYRENYRNNLHRTETNYNALKLEVIKGRMSLPEVVCCFCEGLFFPHSAVKLNSKMLEKIHQNKCHDDLAAHADSLHVCKTCLTYLRKGKVPRLAVTNGFKFSEIPECLKILSDLEERMVSPCINFMQIRSLMPYALNPQLGMKGSVVNIPIDVNDILDVLPRSFDSMSTIQLKLKRHIQHISNYMYDTIRPGVVCDALRYLLGTPLYKKYRIQVNEEYLHLYEGNYEQRMDFIIDPSDKIQHSEDSKEENVMSDPENALTDSENETESVGDDVMVVDRNVTVNDIIVIAPGQDKSPLPWHMQPEIEELSFPKIYGGYSLELGPNISYSERIKSEARRNDRRCCTPTKVLYMAKKKLELSCLSNINVCLRKKNSTENVTVKDVLNNNFVNALIEHDDGYRVLSQIRSSPSYWESKKKHVFAMIRQLGRPALFLTISAAEKSWPELIQLLAKLIYNRKITLEEALNLDEHEKTELIRNDPVTCARYFDQKAAKLMWYLKQEFGPFEEFIVQDTYERVEFQLRGSPHEHIFLWLKDAPIYDSGNDQSVKNCIVFIDKFITCEYDECNPYMSLLRHRHTHTCYKGKRNKSKCRFHFPMPVMPETHILTPLAHEESNADLGPNLRSIKNLMHSFFMKPQKIDFERILHTLCMTKEEYILAIRSGLKRPQVYLRRNSLEVAMNSYNRDILNLFESNIDVQFVLEEYGVASYVVNYISKVDSGLSKLLRAAASDIQSGHKNIRDKLKRIANVFLNGNLMSAQEAAYHVLSMPLSKSSRSSIFINTNPSSKRVMMLKPNKNLMELSADSHDIFMENIFSKYSRRPENLEDVCLAEFATRFTKSLSKYENENDNEDNEYLAFVERQKVKVLRYRKYNFALDPENYYREQALLFLPWRNELNDIENVNCKELYTLKSHIIDANRRPYVLISDETLDQALESAQNEVREIEEEEIQTFVADRVPQEYEVNIMEQGGLESGNKIINRYTTPQRIDYKLLKTKIENLNHRQKEFVLHVVHTFQTQEHLPIHIFLSGSAGVGKSTVIHVLYQAITHHFDNLPGINKDSIKVLICAPSGKAAFLINGVTLHTAFALPVSQFGGQMPELSNDMANSIREQLRHLKLLIIDEISMVGSTLLSRVDTRLRQIMGKSDIFGGVSVILVGDLNQLPPVMDSQVFSAPRISDLNFFSERNPLWEKFMFFELIEIMRQKDETSFITALNNLALGKMTREDIQLIRSREVHEEDVPDEAVRLYSENKYVDQYNTEKINKVPGDLYISTAEDYVLGKVNERLKSRALESLRNKKLSETGGLPTKLNLKINVKYMVTTNLDVDDGLVNGSSGILRYISKKSNSELNKVWIQFENPFVGQKARLPFLKYMSEQNIESSLVPITRKTHTITVSTSNRYQLIRKQFPVIPAEAITIHKSQGQTYKSICIDFKKSKRITRPMMYVALSRVTKLSGLYILGEFRPPHPPKTDDPVTAELENLRSNKQISIQSQSKHQ